MNNEFLIIGRGLAGAILSLRLQRRGMDHHIIDLPSLSSSSKVAAGLINPVVLKRLKLVANGHKFLEEAHHFYTELNGTIDHPWFHEVSIAHIPTSVGEINDWYSKQGDSSYAPFLGPSIKNTTQHVQAPNDLLELRRTAWIDTQAFLDWHKDYLKPNTLLEEAKVSLDHMAELQQSYTHIVLCNGHLMRQLMPQTEEAFSPTRGEVMVIRTEHLPEEYILHGPVFILPLGNQRFKVGATYHWDIMEDRSTPEGLERLQADLEKIYTGPYEVEQHLAGVRPNTKDRKPLLGHLKDNIYCLNGLGSRGALMAPALSQELLDHILSNAPIQSAHDVARFL